MPSLEIHAFSDEFREDAAGLRDLYAGLARDWAARHQVLLPASDGELVDAWFRLTFGCQFMSARARRPAHVLGWAHEHGFRSMTVDWRSVNLLASRFWPRRGWRPTHYRLYRAMP